MKIIQTRIYEGKNIYSHKKCMRLNVDLEGYCEIPSNEIPNFNFNLIKIIPELKDHRCGIDEEGGFVKRLHEGTYLAHICEHVIIAIQNKLGLDVSYGKAREVENDIYYIIVEYEYQNIVIESARLAIDLVNSLIKQFPINFDERFSILQDTLRKDEIGPSTKAICDAAKEYNLPVTQIGSNGIYQIGYGKKGRLIEATIGNNTRCISVDISCDKLLTKEFLQIQNIPVAEGYKAFNFISLLKDAEEIGYPVVLKPQYGNKGKGVILNIKNEKELVKSYNNLKLNYEDIIVEKYIQGKDYRICVINYKIIAVSLRVAPFVIGNGIDTLGVLINKLNEDPLRGEDHEKPLTKIKIDNELISCISKKKMSLDSVLKNGEKVFLRENANISTGGMAVDCTEEICKENIDYCIRAAKSLGLDICGIDLCTLDISKPINNTNGVIMEINAAPGIRMHHYPSIGQKRNVGREIVNMMYNGNPSTIPIVSVTGTNGKTTTTRLISYVLKKMGNIVGMTSTDGIYLNDNCIHKGDDSGFNSAKTVLLNRDIDVAVLETARGGLIRKGLAYNLADVAVITNITNDHIGLDNINSMEELSFVKALVGEAVKPDGVVVVNADDKWSIKIVNRFKAEKIYFSKYKDNELIKENIAMGGTAIFIDDGEICVVSKNKKYNIISIKDLSISYNGVLEYNIENAMSACGALIGLKVDYCMISKGFSEFKLNNKENSGRFNVYDFCNRKIILDYGHNIEGYRAVLNSLDKIKGKNNLIGVIGIPGDRSNDVAYEIGNICSEGLDKIIIKEDKDRRGRKIGEIANLLKESILKNNKDKSVSICLDEVQALKFALDISNTGDTIVVFYEDLDKLVDFIKNKNPKNTLNNYLKYGGI